ncbi:MAG: hypothetical protein IJ629_07175 [Clostridia bacterium]|nr:hypothetical protein [Clostridia bacterium]
MNKLDLKEISKLNDDNKIYEILFNKVFELGNEIIQLKKINYEVLYEDDKDKELYSMSEEIYYQSIWFESFRSLTSYIRDWNFEEFEDISDEVPCEMDYFEMDNQELSRAIVKVYNEVLDEIDSYKKQKERIEKEGIENIEEGLFKGLKEIFCKMLDYKNRKYDKEGSLSDLIEELVLCYSDYKWMFDETYTMLKRFVYKDTMRDDFWMVEADDVEYISSLEFTYKFFAENEDNYKNYNQFYEDITLKEGQTLEDLYDEEREKLKALFVEMLEFLNIEIEDKSNYSTLEILVGKYYPYYYQNLISINGAHKYSYIDLIHTLKTNYDYFKRNYKNHEEDLKYYIKKEEEALEEAKKNGEMLYDPEWIEDLEELKNYFKEYFED